jgi:calcineurin-like phosphoesterase family protein
MIKQGSRFFYLNVASLLFTLSLTSPQAFAQDSGLINDGPYVNWQADGSISVEAVCNSRLSPSQILSATQAPYILKDPCTQQVVTTINATQTVAPSSYSGVEKFIALSDVEGHYSDFVKMLQTYKVIDSNLQWTYGRGHLILLGDMVDRGDKVTEVLWLIHRLEGEALSIGGRVHYILGNHEKMNLEGDDRYVHEKYIQSAEILGKTHKSLFSNDTELGRWMRSKNSLVKINDSLFVHAGLSSELLKISTDLTAINNGIRLGLTKPETKASNSSIKWLLSSDGPLWYRGYFKDEDLNSSEIKSVLDSLDVSRVIVGHTIVPNIQFLHDDLVLAIDTGFSKPKKIQGLIFEKGQFWKASLSGKRETL